MTVESTQEVSKKIRILFCMALASGFIELIYGILISVRAIVPSMVSVFLINIVMDVLLICGYLGILLSRKLRIWGAVVFGLSIVALAAYFIFILFALISPLMAQIYAPFFEVIATLPGILLLIRIWKRGLSLKILLIIVIVCLCLYIVYDIYVILALSDVIPWETFDALVTSLSVVMTPLSYARRVIWIVFWLVLITRPSRILLDE